MIKCGARRVPFGMNEDKFRRLRASLAIPEVILLGDPVWNDIRDVNTMPQVPRKKLLRALVVFTRPLRQTWRDWKERNHSSNGQDPAAKCHHLSRLSINCNCSDRGDWLFIKDWLLVVTFRPDFLKQEFQAFCQDLRTRIFPPLLEAAISKSRKLRQLTGGEIEFARKSDYVYCMHLGASTPIINRVHFLVVSGSVLLDSVLVSLTLPGLRTLPTVLRALGVLHCPVNAKNAKSLGI